MTEAVAGEETMDGLEALHSVQYVTVNGRRLAVLSADDWEALVEWLETNEDLRLAKECLARLREVEGSREKAGWHRWEDVRGDLE